MPRSNTPQFALDRIRSVVENRLSTLHLDNMGLHEIPDELLTLSANQCSQIEEIYFTKNQIANIPDSFSKFSNLKRLDLSYNRILSISNSLTQLTNLSMLNLSHNKIVVIPDSLSQLANLSELYLGFNQIVVIPDSLSQLTNLKVLYLNSNGILSIPDSLVQLKYLTGLDLSSNQIANIPDSFKQFTNLTGLYLNSNKMTKIPRFISELKSLSILNLNRNSLEFPPSEICDKGLYAIRDYFRQLDEQGFERIYEARLLIVGQPGAGKTTLRFKLLDENYQLRMTEESTQGIETSTLKFPVPDSEDMFSMHIWDFGGQEIQYATHQFFLTPRSLYVLLGDDRRQDTLWDDWFDMIKLFGQNSPVLVVLNERNGNKVTNFDLNTWRDYVEGKFVVETRDVDLSDPYHDRLRAILHKIQDMICQLDHIGDVLPALWPTIREKLAKRIKKNHISLDVYRKICAKAGLKNESYQDQLLGYLRDLGEVLHFNEGDLRETVFLNPRWVLDSVYAALTHKELQENNGQFTRKWIYQLWKTNGYKGGECRTLLDLMAKDHFDICYETDKKEGLIAPQLLPTKRPEFEWDEASNLLFRFTYAYKPRGLMARLIVRIHRYIHERIVWRNGVLLVDRNAKALVRDYTTARKGLKVILIATSGPVLARRELMSTVRETLRVLHKQSFPNIAVTEEIPFQSDRDEAVPYDFLRQLQMDGVRNFHWPGERDPVSVSQMLDGFEKDHRNPNEDRIQLYMNIKNEGHNIQIENNSSANPTTNQSVHQTANPNINMANNAQANINAAFTMSIQQTWKEMAETLAELQDDLVDIDPSAAEEVQTIAVKVDKVLPNEDNPDSKKAVRGPINKLKRFVDNLQNPEHKISKAVQRLKDGAEIVKDLSEKVAKIWTWYQS